MMKRALVCGAGGFIGGHLVKRLKAEGFWVRGVDIKRHEYAESAADEFLQGDLRIKAFCDQAVDQKFDEIYQLAADMGGAGFVFTGDHDAEIMHNSAMINLNILECVREQGVGEIFYSSSACMYPEYNQLDPSKPVTAEESAYPAAPDSEYGWEKLFSERLYFAYHRNYGINVKVARFHNIFGEEGTWEGGREKAPAAMCRKVAEAEAGGVIEMWGDGNQTRSFLHVDECLEAMRRFMDAPQFRGPVNIGSEEMVSINELARMVMEIAHKQVPVRHIDGPIGVQGRNSDNTLIRKELGWAPSQPLHDGLRRTYAWVAQQVAQRSTQQQQTVIS
jgi:GDP-D-mannose 3', 5'-epimerase